MTADPLAHPQIAPSDTDGAIESIVAYRCWLMDESGRLRSPSESVSWPATGWTSAECAWPHDAPAERCSCGIHALKDLRALKEDALTQRAVALCVAGNAKERRRSRRLRVPQFVYGKVALAGRVIEREDGYRAARARVVAVLDVAGQPDLLELVASRYRVPLIADPVVLEELTSPPDVPEHRTTPRDSSGLTPADLRARTLASLAVTPRPRLKDRLMDRLREVVRAAVEMWSTLDPWPPLATLWASLLFGSLLGWLLGTQTWLLP